MILKNFKGIPHLDISFGNITNIFARNKKGKTTIADAFTWVCFGKDSLGRADFNIKTLDKNNVPISRLDHEVRLFMRIDGDPIEIRRHYKENWVKKQGKAIPVFSGHTTSFYWNEVPLQLNEYNKKIADIIDESLFRLITGVAFFNSMKWEARRKVLEEIGGQPTDKELLAQMVAAGESKYQQLIDALVGKKTVDEYRKELVNKKKRLADEMETIPHRIAEANNSLPDPIDFAAEEERLSELNAELASVENLLSDQSAAEQEVQKQKIEKVNRRGTIAQQRQSAIVNIESRIKSESTSRAARIRERTGNYKAIEGDLNRLITQFTNDSTRLEGIIARRDQGRAEWSKIDEETITFNDGDFCCPTCKRMFEADKISERKGEMIANFNKDKSRRLEEITAAGLKLNAEIETLQAAINNTKAAGESKRSELTLEGEAIQTLIEEDRRLTQNEAAEIENAIATDPEILEFDRQLAAIDSEVIEEAQGSGDRAELTSRKSTVNHEILDVRNRLALRGQREKIEARITELTNRESELSGELSDMEKAEFLILEFSKSKMTALENRINERFKYVRFKMFETNINGGEVPCCETLIDGVPYSDANTAARINAGIDIINVLSDHYQVSAPLFVDNAESVNELITAQMQLIRLVVSLDDEIRVESY